MSDIQNIIEHCEWQADKGQTPSAYQEHIHLLQALDVLADNLESIATALELRNLHQGITTDRGE